VGANFSYIINPRCQLARPNSVDVSAANQRPRGACRALTFTRAIADAQCRCTAQAARRHFGVRDQSARRDVPWRFRTSSPEISDEEPHNRGYFSKARTNRESRVSAFEYQRPSSIIAGYRNSVARHAALFPQIGPLVNRLDRGRSWKWRLYRQTFRSETSGVFGNKGSYYEARFPAILTL
jgi:hypothetical protein